MLKTLHSTQQVPSLTQKSLRQASKIKFWTLCLLQTSVLLIFIHLPKSNKFFNLYKGYPRGDIDFVSFCNMRSGGCEFQKNEKINKVVYFEEYQYFKRWKYEIEENQVYPTDLFCQLQILNSFILIGQTVFRDTNFIRKSQNIIYFIKLPLIGLQIQYLSGNLIFSHQIYYGPSIFLIILICQLLFFTLNEIYFQFEFLKSHSQLISNKFHLLLTTFLMIYFLIGSHFEIVLHIVTFPLILIYLLKLNKSLFDDEYLTSKNQQKSFYQTFKDKIIQKFEESRVCKDNQYLLIKKQHLLFCVVFAILLFSFHQINLQIILLLTIIFCFETSITSPVLVLLSQFSKITEKDVYLGASMFLFDLFLPFRSQIIEIIV